MKKNDGFNSILKELQDIYTKKNHDYGNSFTKTFDEFGLIASCIRLQDKMNRVCSLIKKDPKVVDESIRDTFVDIANYAIMTVMELDKKKG